MNKIDIFIKYLIVLLGISASPLLAVVPEDFSWGQFDPSNGSRIYYRLFEPEKQPNQKYPLVVFFQGIGEHGGLINTSALEKFGGPLAFADKRTQGNRPCYVLTMSFVQQTSSYNENNRNAAYEFIDHLKASANYAIDEKRLYCLGLSDGAAALTRLEVERPDLFAAGIAIGNNYSPSNVEPLVNYPIWFHSGEADVGSHLASLFLYDSLDKMEGSHRLTLYPRKGHLIMNVFNDPEVQSWLFQWVNDETPPASPQNIVTSAKTDHVITLSWDAVVDAESLILEYWVYRDGNRIARVTANAHGSVAPTSYMDEGLNANTSYSYEILAVNAGGKKSVLSSPYVASTLVDTTGVTLRSVEEIDGRIRLRFDEGVNVSIAEDISSYNFSSGHVVNSAHCYSSGTARFVGGPRGQTTTVKIGRQARYVRVQLVDRIHLSLAEVEVMNTSTNTNLALAGTASQSSNVFGAIAARAIDGNTNGNFPDGSVTHTNGSSGEDWWEVDLGSVQHIDEIRIWNRTDRLSERLSNFYVFVSEKAFASERVSHVLGQFDSSTVDLDVQGITLFDSFDLTINSLTDTVGNNLINPSFAGRLWPTRSRSVHVDMLTDLTVESNQFAYGYDDLNKVFLDQPIVHARPTVENQGTGKVLSFDGVDDFVEAGEVDFDYTKGATMIALVKAEGSDGASVLFHSGTGRKTLSGSFGSHDLARDFHDVNLVLENGHWKYDIYGDNRLYTSLVSSKPASGDWQVIVVRQSVTSGNMAYTEMFVDGELAQAGNYRIPDKIRRVHNWIGRGDQIYTSSSFRAFKGRLAAFNYYNEYVPDDLIGFLVNELGNHYQIDKQKYYLRNLLPRIVGEVGSVFQPDFSESVASGFLNSPVYQWSVVAGGSDHLLFSSKSVLAPQITPNAVGDYILNLRVENDAGALVANHYITVSIYDSTDTTLPEVTGQRVIGNNLIEISFNKPVLKVTAENVANYQLNRGAVNQAIYNVHDASVVIKTSVLDLRQNLTLAVSGVNDLKGNTMMATSLVLLSNNSLLYLETFEGEFKENWQVIDEGNQYNPSSWNVSEGVLRQTSNIFDGLDINPERRGSMLIFPSSLRHFDEYILSANMRSSDDDGMGLVFNYHDPDNYYVFEMDAQRDFRRLLRRTAGKTTVIGFERGGYVLNENQLVVINYTRGKMSITLNGSRLFGGDITDTVLPSGEFGIWSWGNWGLAVNDVSVVTAPIGQSWLRPYKQIKFDGSDPELTGRYPYEKSKNAEIVYDEQTDLRSLDLKSSQESAAVFDLPNLSGQSFSVSVYAKSNSATWNAFEALVTRMESFALGTETGSTRVNFLILTWGVWHNISVDMASLGLDIRDWHCYTGVYDWENKKCKLYVNGKLVAETNAPNAMRVNAGPLYLGKGDDPLAARFLSGNIADFRLFSHALSDAEVYRVYVGEDTDGDGLGDHWERRILAASISDSINRLSHVGGASDFDQDGVIDVAEYHFGTDPLQKNTDTLIKWIRLSADQNSFDICISAKKSRKYALFASETLNMTDPWVEIQDSGFITSDGDHTFRVPKGVFNSRFFRVEAKVE